MTSWEKVDPKKHYVEVRRGKYRTTYRLIFRGEGLNIRERLKGDFPTPKDAIKEADRVLAERRFGPKQDPAKAKTLIRSEVLCDEIVALKKALAPATATQTEIFFRVHIKPFLNRECAYLDDSTEKLIECPHRIYLESGACEYAENLNPTQWLAYKTHLRLHRPETSLFNHWKFWTMLFKYAFDKNILPRQVKLAFDEEKEDNRKEGQLIPDAAFRAIIACANSTWRRRMIVQRLCGQRPKVVRGLRKSQINLETGLTNVEKGDSKNRRAYDFYMPESALVELRAQAKRYSDSPYFFPNERDRKRHQDKHLNGWHSAIATAHEMLLEQAQEALREGDQALAQAKTAVADSFPKDEGNPWTPHDLRHTRLTELAKTPGINHAVTCYQHDLSLNEWFDTYAHFEASDTRPIAADAQVRAAVLLRPEETR